MRGRGQGGTHTRGFWVRAMPWRLHFRGPKLVKVDEFFEFRDDAQTCASEPIVGFSHNPLTRGRALARPTARGSHRASARPPQHTMWVDRKGKRRVPPKEMDAGIHTPAAFLPVPKSTYVLDESDEEVRPIHT